ncbi:hypothetical protein [Niveispirillum sp. BGYR6]|uniref:glycosyltransferase n=1 Tax=Niveispirillum sp. BGYR6 TaxID=2971249 RepID=UPI0022B9C8AF|nr:hypothetical protein [Niveispirillum sp. BGYR6]MDG5497434.1 hypothetical protein [Niveispirillum sp. BGYR6]
MLFDVNNRESKLSKVIPRGARIAALFDTSFGYGTPQLELLMSSLAHFYEASDCVMFEPDVKNKPKLRVAAPGIRIERLATRFPPHFDVFHVEYNLQLIERISDLKPNVLVVTSAAVMPALLKLPYKPDLVIYYMLESIDYQRKLGGQDFVNLLQIGRSRIDLICVPEMNRANFDLRYLGWDDIPVVEVLNVSLSKFIEGEKSQQPVIINAGSICESAQCDYFERDLPAHVRVDICGIPSSKRMIQMVDGFRSNVSQICYLGSLTMEELEEIYSRYAYSICMWKPSDINQIHASPNKLFQSIAHGVPPIAAPHPQCVSIIREYGCGILMDGWSFQDFYSALERAQKIYGTSTYHDMVENCRFATEHELNWPAQFSKLSSHLPTAA